LDSIGKRLNFLPKAEAPRLKPQIGEFPCIFPWNREPTGGDRFAVWSGRDGLGLHVLGCRAFAVV